MTVYDKAKWHFEGDFPKDLPIKQAYVHIGFYLAWAIDQGFEGSLLTGDFCDELAQYRAGKISGPRLLEITDGVLDDQMLSEAGNRFTSDFYDSEYLDYYSATFPNLKTIYYVEDTEANYTEIKKRLDACYSTWKSK